MGVFFVVFFFVGQESPGKPRKPRKGQKAPGSPASAGLEFAGARAFPGSLGLVPSLAFPGRPREVRGSTDFNLPDYPSQDLPEGA